MTDFQTQSKAYALDAWRQRHARSMTWLGAPIEQMPEDLIRIQELIVQVKPAVIVETGVQWGGSVLYYASLLQLVGNGIVVGIDTCLHHEALTAVEQSSVRDRIWLKEGDSADPDIARRVRSFVGERAPCMVILDSDHRCAHVLAELEHYAPLVTPGSYVVVCDTIMADLTDENPAWDTDNPAQAIAEFLQDHPEFEAVTPARPYDKSRTRAEVSHWPGGYLRRRDG